MNRLVSSAAVAALTLIASLPALPAYAAPVTLVVADIDLLPGDTFGVTGDGDDCPVDAAGAAGTFTVTMTYKTPAGTNADVKASGNVAADGTFASSLTLPVTAVSDQPTSVVSATTCGATTTASNRVTLLVKYHPGTLTLSVPTVAAGGTVTAKGIGCFGGEYVIVYGPAGGDPNDFEDGSSGIPAADRTFTSTLTIPATLAAGPYDVYALCPGAQFAAVPLAITAAAPTATISASPSPVASAPTTTTTLGGGFTGEGDGGSGTTGGGTTGTTGTGTTGTGTTGTGTNTPVATAPVAVRGEATFTG